MSTSSAPSLDPFQAAWRSFHPDSVPVGKSLRDGGAWNLTRFHLLPNGRDAAVSRGEYRGLIDRFNVLATEVLGEGAECWLVVPDPMGPDGQPVMSAPTERARFFRLKKRYGLTPRWDFYSAADSCVYNIEAAPVVWRAHGFDRLFLAIYHERLNNIMIMNAQTGAVIAPYEAGLYASQPTPEALMTLIGSYYGWLPVTGDGILRFDPKQSDGGKFQVSKACAAAIQRALGT